MTTPAYTNVSGDFPSIRYYTQFDPYFYTVDNRPLGDLANSDSVVGAGVDAASRATLIKSLGDSVIFKDLYGSASFTTGLELSNPSSNTLRVGSGALYSVDAITTTDSRQVLKQALLPVYKDFAIPAPLTVGQSVVYLVQGKHVDFGAETSEGFPFYDTANTRLPSSLLHGELQLQVITGVAATTGTQVAPAPSAGWTPLFTVTVDYAGTSFYNAGSASGSPATKGLSKVFGTMFNRTTSTSVLGDTEVTTFSNGSAQQALVKLPIDSSVNQYKPVKVKIDYTPSVIDGAFAARIKYQVVGNEDLVSPVSYTVGALETIAVTTAVNSVNSYTFSASIPGYLLTGKHFVNIIIERLGADVSDTNTGNMNVITVTAFQ